MRNTNFVDVEGRTLHAALKKMTVVIYRRSTIPILCAVRITYADGKLKLSGTNLDMWISTIVDEIDGGGEFDIAVPAHLLTKIVSLAGNEVVRIFPASGMVDTGRTERNKACDLAPVMEPAEFAMVTFGDAEYSVMTLRPSDLPDAPGEAEVFHNERYSNGAFAEALRRVSWCVSTEETRYYLNGVCIRFGKSGTRFIATDGHRLAAFTYDTEASEDRGAIIPSSAVYAISAIMRGRDCLVRIDEKSIHIDDGPTVIHSKLIEATFPDVDRVIPDGTRFDLRIDKTTFADAVRRASAMMENGRAVTIAKTGYGISVEMKNQDIGKSRVIAHADWSGECLAPPGKPSDVFGFNARHLLDVLSVCTGTVQIGAMDAGSPFIFRDEDRQMMRVMMPMRV